MYGNPYYEPYAGYEEYLEHFGVKGMKWGIRRYQNENGSLTEAGKAKLKKYKDKEYKRVDKLRAKYEDKYSRALHKRKAKGGTLPFRNEKYWKNIKDAYETELKAIKKMKYKDMQSDKRAVGQQWLKSAVGSAVLGTTVSVAMAAPYIGVWWGPVSPRGISNAKTRNRLKREGAW